MLNRGITKATTMSPPSFLKQLHHMTSEFDIFSLVWLALTMASTLWSPWFVRWCASDALECNYIIDGHEYNIGYYLCDGIYPPCVIFV